MTGVSQNSFVLYFCGEKRVLVDRANNGQRLDRFFQAFFKEMNEIGEVAGVSAFHRQEIVLVNLVTLGHELDLGEGHRLLYKRE